MGLFKDLKSFLSAFNEWKETTTITINHIGVVARSPEFMPIFKTVGAVGADARAFIPGSYPKISIQPGETRRISLGIKMKIPDSLEVQVRSRSGLSSEKQLLLLTGVSTIDSDYRGEVFATFKNLSTEPIAIEHGDRIVQLVPQYKCLTKWVSITENQLDTTERGAGGFGHTGVK